MTKTEFATVIAWLESAIGKSIDATTEQCRVRTGIYYEMLSDLPIESLWIAARKAVLQPLYNAFPSIEILRRMATEDTTVTTAGEAWNLACAACRSFGIDRAESGLASLPPLVAKAVRCFGWAALCDSNPRDCDTARAQFRGIFDALAVKERRTESMPESLRDARTPKQIRNTILKIENKPSP